MNARRLRLVEGESGWARELGNLDAAALRALVAAGELSVAEANESWARRAQTQVATRVGGRK